MTKTVRLCDMCGETPRTATPAREGEVVIAVDPWISVNKASTSAGDVIQPGNYELCCEACLQRLVGGELTLAQKEAQAAPLPEEPPPTAVPA